MSPNPGSYPASQQITLYVSGGGIKVPNVLNDTETVAVEILKGDGFTNVQAISTPAPASDMVQPGTVYEQNPTNGSVEPSGTLIQVFVQPQTTTPTPTPTVSTSGTGTPTNSPSPTPTPTPTTTGSPTATGTPTASDTPTTGDGGGGNGGGGNGGGGGIGPFGQTS